MRSSLVALLLISLPMAAQAVKLKAATFDELCEGYRVGKRAELVLTNCDQCAAVEHVHLYVRCPWHTQPDQWEVHLDPCPSPTMERAATSIKITCGVR